MHPREPRHGSCRAGAHTLASSLAIAISLVACRRDSARESPAPPPPAASADCSRGPGAVADPLTQNVFPPKLGELCIDPSFGGRAFGQNASHPLEEVCTELFDGECESYKLLGLDRVVSVKYLIAGKPGTSIEVHLSRFPSDAHAYAFYTRRLIGDADPAKLKLRELSVGASSAAGAGVLYFVQGTSVAELTYLDNAASADELRGGAVDRLATLAKAMAGALPKGRVPVVLERLPREARVPLGTVVTQKDLQGIKGFGGGAVGYYQDGLRRWRVGLALANEPQAGKRAMEAASAWAKSGTVRTLTDVGFEAFSATHQEDAASAELSFVFGRHGDRVAFVADEPEARRARLSPEQAAAVSLDEPAKIERLARALGIAAPPRPAATSAAAPSASASARPD